jgi:DNA-binding CsgD family transcriptional regulator
MLHGLFWLTANLADRRPVLLAIDDLHWCDQPSLRWLAYLLPRIDGLPVLVAVGLRPTEPGADLSILAHITADPRATVLRPGALSEEATGTLLGHMLSTDVEPTFAAALHEECGGNPLLVRELASAVTAEGLTPTASSVSSVRELGGQAISRAVSLRLSRLSPEATRLAQAVAILGDGAEPRHAAALAELDEETAADSADDLKRVQILRHESAWAFVHPVVRSAVYAELPAGERVRQHRRAARLLAESAADPERIAAQLLPTAARGDGWAVSALREAARSAVARGAPDGAVAYLRRALEEPPVEQLGAVLHELGSAEARIAAPEALAHLAEARAVARDALSRGGIALELVRAQFALGEPARASVELLQEAIGELPVDDSSELALELETQLVGIARQDPELQPLAAERLRRLRAALPQLSAGRAVVLANLASAAAHAGVGRDEAIELAEQALADSSLLKEHFDPEFIYAVDTLSAADRLDAALRLYGEAIDDAARRGLAAQYFLASCCRSTVAFLRGSLADAVADAELCLAAIETNGLESFRPTAVAILARPLIERGEAARAGEALDSASRGLDAFESAMPMSASFFVARARLRLEEGAYEEVVHDLVGRGQRATKSGLRNPALFAWRSLAALALLGLGRNEEARRYAAEELALSREWGAPRSLGRSLIAAGLAEGGDDGIALLREAVAVLEPSEARFEYARALVELGAALRRANRRAESREPLRGGMEQATRCGAAPLAERAATELLATGARPRRVALSGVESLTPSERRVAQMAADGGTNREIAQELFVTPKTVEVHLSSAYRKLDISARSQLAAALAVPAPAGSTAGE